MDQVPWILRNNFANTVKKENITDHPLFHWWMMAGTLESFPSWFRKMCVINFFVLKFSLAVTLLCETCGLVFVALFVTAVVFCILHLVACVFICLMASGFAFFFSKEYLPWFCFFSFHHEVWAGAKPPEQFNFGKLAFLLSSLHSLFSFFPCFRWPVLHMGAEQLRSAGLGQRMSLPSQSTACQVSRWDPFGSGCCRRSPQFCPFSLRSCVWLGEEQLRTAGTKWWTRYENYAPRWKMDRLLWPGVSCCIDSVFLLNGYITQQLLLGWHGRETVSVSAGFSYLVKTETSPCGC